MATTWNDWIAENNGRWPGGGQIFDLPARYATRGTVFSTQFSNNERAPEWSVHRVVRNVRETRGASVP